MDFALRVRRGHYLAAVAPPWPGRVPLRYNGVARVGVKDVDDVKRAGVNDGYADHWLFKPIRQELLQWVNNLLQLNVTKVEQCGTGYA